MITMEYGIYSGGILVAKRGFDFYDGRPNANALAVISGSIAELLGRWPDSYWLPLDPDNMPKIGSPEPSQIRTVANS